MHDRTAIITCAAGLIAFAGTLSALPGKCDPSAAEIDQWLNNTDSSWGQTAAAPQGNSMQSWPSSQSSRTSNSGWQRAADRPRIQGTPLNRPRTMQQPFGKLTPQDVFRIMFGGGGGSGGGGSSGDYARNQEAYGNASSYMQTALDQAAQAESAAARASYGSDKYARQSAAAEAQNHANAARGAADSATSAASGATGAAQDQAAKARDAANRAQYAADRAAANANGGGW